MADSSGETPSKMPIATPVKEACDTASPKKEDLLMTVITPKKDKRNDTKIPPMRALSKKGNVKIEKSMFNCACENLNLFLQNTSFS